MSSKYHTALIKDAATLIALGASDVLVTYIDAFYSVTPQKFPMGHASAYIQDDFMHFQRVVKIRWRTRDHPHKFGDIVKSLSIDGIPTFTIAEIDIVKEGTRYQAYYYEEKENVCETFRFRSVPLKSDAFWEQYNKTGARPSKRLYIKLQQTKRELKEKGVLIDESLSRFKPAHLMINSTSYTPRELREIWWHNCPYILLLKEAQGRFELMELGEYE